MYSIGQLSRKFNLSRSTLLYYDSIGILSPSGRTASNYRSYSETDEEKLRKICMYRETGLPLEDIQAILNSQMDNIDEMLEKHLDALNMEMKRLEIRRRIILQMLTSKKRSKQASNSARSKFVKLLKDAGLDDEKLIRLHSDFEKVSPDEHLAFLKFLGIPEDEIKMIKKYSQKLILD